MTDDEDGDNPTGPPISPISSMVGSDSMKGSEDTSYLGTLTEADAQQLVNRHFSVTRLTDMLVHMVANDRRFGYGSVSEVIRHAVEMLMLYYVDNRFLLEEHHGFANDILRQQHELRLDSERAKIRLEFADNVKILDKEMDAARQIGDWEFIGRRLGKYATMLENCESETQMRLLREILAASVATRSSAVAFYRWINAEFRVPIDNWNDEWPALAGRWNDWYNDLSG